MYTIERFDDVLGNATMNMSSGRPYLWETLNEMDSLRNAIKFARKQSGNVRIIRNSRETLEIRGGRNLELASEALAMKSYPRGDNLDIEKFITDWVDGPGWFAADPGQDHVHFLEGGKSAALYRKTYDLR